jgi:4-amino-4-deoxy-L-arabinose transferase-like glycosyltransferase
VPPWQAPDEAAHFGYAQVLVERHARPDRSPGRLFSREQQLALDRTDADRIAGNPLAKPDWRPLAERAWQAADSRLGPGARSDGGHRGPEGRAGSPARANPPLYYAYEGVPYLVASGGSIFDRLELMRLWSALLLVVAASATWLLIGELFGRRPLLQLTGAALVGLEPMASFISASVNADAMLIPTWALVFWLGARVLRRGLTLASGAALVGALALALLVKGTSYALVPAVAFALGAGTWLRRPQSISPRALVAGLALVAAAVGVPVAIAVLRRAPRVPGGSVGDFLGYLWQFYLPNLPHQHGFPQLLGLPVYERWIKGLWGSFGWLEVQFHNPVYLVLAAVTVVLLAAGLLALVRHRSAANLRVAAFAGLAALALLAGLHWTEYGMLRSSGAAFNQGRYLLPLLPLLGACAASLLHLLGPRRAPVASGALLGGLAALQIASLAIVTVRFYA